MLKQNCGISDAEKQKKPCAKKKQTLVIQLAGKNESNAAKLRKFTYSFSGWSSVEHRYLDLHQPIAELVTAGAGADMQRPINALKFCKTLDDLCAGLLKKGYVLSRQTLYLPLIPRRFDNVEGK